MVSAKAPGPFDKAAPSGYLVAGVHNFDWRGIDCLEVFRIASGHGEDHASPHIIKT
jgi:hypothetical protein